MEIREIVEQEKVSYELWRQLAGRVKESQWLKVMEWLEDEFQKYDEKTRRDILWLLQTIK